MIYSNDPKVKLLQNRYWNEIDDYITAERERSDIRHGTASNLALTKLNFFQKLVDEIKSLKKIDQYEAVGKKELPLSERQTVDVDEYENENAILNPNKQSPDKPKSRYGSW